MGMTRRLSATRIDARELRRAIVLATGVRLHAGQDAMAMLLSDKAAIRNVANGRFRGGAMTFFLLPCDRRWARRQTRLLSDRPPVLKASLRARPCVSDLKVGRRLAAAVQLSRLLPLNLAGSRPIAARNPRAAVQSERSEPRRAQALIRRASLP